MSSITAGTTTTTAFTVAGDTTGALVFKTNGGTTALTIDTSQAATFAGTVTATGGIVTSAGVLEVAASSTSGAVLRLPEDTDNGSNYVAFKAPDAIASNVTWTLPDADGTSGQVLSTNGSGTLSWASGGGGGSSITAGDSSVEVTDTGSNGTATFTMDNTVRAKVNAYGIGLGTETPSSGMGIKFPVTQSASSDANTLDDYEEGTFTPSYSATGATFTYQYQNGRYRKIGSQVFVEIFLRTSAVSGGSGNVSIVGLPFGVNLLVASQQVVGGPVIYANNFTGDAPTSVATAVNNSTSVLMWYRTASNTDLDLVVQASDLGTGANGNWLSAQLFYVTND